MAIPIGHFLAELDPGEPLSLVRVIRDKKILWEAESIPYGADLGPIMDEFPTPDCRSLLVTAYSGGGHCCYSEVLLTVCGANQILTVFNLEHSPLATEQRNRGWIVHADDWSFAYYMLDKKRFLPFSVSLPITRVLIFDPAKGWRPDKPGELPRLHRLFQIDMEDTTPNMPDNIRAARAITASAHAYLASGSRIMARQTLARLLPKPWLADLDTVLADVLEAVEDYNPCENMVFRK